MFHLRECNGNLKKMQSYYFYLNHIGRIINKYVPEQLKEMMLLKHQHPNGIDDWFDNIGRPKQGQTPLI